MEVAASVGGLISLGLQVAGGLIAYLDAIKDRDEDLCATTKRAGLLRNQILAIQSITQASDTKLQNVTDNVRECILECESQLKPLEDFLLEESDGQLSSSSTPGSNRSKLKEAVLRIKIKGTYPFRRSRIEALKRKLDGATDALDTALTTFDVYLSSVIHEDVSTVLESSRTLESRVSEADAKIYAGFRRTELALQNQSQQLNQSLPLIEQVVTNVKETVDVIHMSQANIATQLGGVEGLVEAALQRGLANYESRMKETLQEYLGCTSKDFDNNLALQRMGAKPAALRSIADSLGGPSALALTQSKDDKHSFLGELYKPLDQALIAACDCKTRFYRTTRWGRFSFHEDRYTHQHMPGCPRFGIPVAGSKRSYGVTWGGLLKLVSTAVEITFSVNSGSGAWGLAPYLTTYRMVDGFKDPAFALTYVLKQWASTRHKRQRQIRKEIVHSYFSRLENAYRNRRSCVTDYTEDSGSILQAIFPYRQNGAWSPITDEYLDTVLPYIKNLVQSWDAPVGSGISGRSPLALLFDFEWMYGGFKLSRLETYEMLYLRSDEPLESCSGLSQKSLSIAANSSESIRDALSLSPLEIIILRRDMAGLKRMLGHVWNPKFWTNAQGMSPLHLAVGWPEGLEKLLETAPDEIINKFDISDRDSTGRTALFYALELTTTACCEGESSTVCKNCDCYRSAEVLLRYGAVFFSNRMLMGSMRAQILLLENLKERCLALRKLLPEKDGLRLSHEVDEGWDVGIQRTYDILQEIGATIPLVLKREFKYWHPVYARTYNTAVAEIAYQLGFRDVNGGHYPMFSYVPLATRLGPDMVSWLLDHGASLDNAHGSKLVAHRALSSITDPVYRRRRETATRVLATGARLKVSDGCVCKCTEDGCYPLTCFLRDAHQRGNVDFIGLLEECGLDLTGASWIPYHCIRAITFEEFGLRHTCCHEAFDCFEKSLGDICEYPGTDADKEAGFESLINELKQDFEKGHQTFRDFMGSTRRDKTRDALAALESRLLGKDDKHKLEEFGTVWSPSAVKPAWAVVREEIKRPEFWLELMDRIVPELGDNRQCPGLTAWDLSALEQIEQRGWDRL